MGLPRLDVPYMGMCYVPPVANSTLGWAQSSWFAINVADDATISTLDATAASPPSYYTDTFYTNHVAAITQGNHWRSYPKVAAGGSGDAKANSSVAALSPRMAALSQLGYCVGATGLAPAIGTVRHFLSLDQLFKAGNPISGVGAGAALAVGTILEPEAVLNFIDFCALCHQLGLKLIVPLFVSDETAGHTHPFFYQALQNISGTAAAQTATQANQTQSYLNALTEFLQFVDAYDIVRSTVAGFDLHNECYYQLGATGGPTGLTHLVAGGYNNAAIQADAKVWIQKLIQTANKASGNFLYTISENSRLGQDSPDALRAPSLANQQAAMAMYRGVGFYDLHWYVNDPAGIQFTTNVATAAQALASCKNLDRPWIAGEVAGDSSNGGFGTIYDGNAPTMYQAFDYFFRRMQDFGAMCVCGPAVGNISNQTSVSNGVGINYEDQGATALCRAIHAARASHRLLS